MEPMNYDALIPASMAEKAEQIGIKKAGTSAGKLFMLAVLAGAYIALGGIFSTTITAGTKDLLPFGIIKLIGGLGFSLGLILVIVGGAELFTGNILIIMAFANRKVSIAGLLRNWVIVYLGNLAGAMATAVLVFMSKQYLMGGGAIGLNMITIAEGKSNLDFVQAVTLGILCNAVVCMAVWLTYSARSTTDKIMAIIPTIAAFVAAGFEHSVANMYFLPVALLVKYFGGAGFFELVHKTPADFPHITITNALFTNLLPVTLGNILGGAVCVGLVYWFIYLKKN